MANDRLFIRCTACGDYQFLGKHYPRVRAWVDQAQALIDFVDKHIDQCVQLHLDLGDDPLPLVFDNETTLCAAGGLIGGSGNVNTDKSAGPASRP